MKKVEIFCEGFRGIAWCNSPSYASDPNPTQLTNNFVINLTMTLTMSGDV